VIRLVPFLLGLAPALALAGPCDSLVTQGATREGAALVEAYAAVLRCDKAVAETAFPTFMRETGDAETLVALSLAAIDAEVYAPVWQIMSAVRDHGQRTAVAEGIGAACAEHANVSAFLQGAYFGLRGLVFTPWARAIPACGSEELDTWARGVLAAPPATTYDEKYAAVSEAVVDMHRAEALPLLRDAAIAAAANRGPFDALLALMDSAVEPDGFGTAPSAADEAALREALVAVAQAVPAEKVALVGDRLSSRGAEDQAAALLPLAWPGKHRPDGSFVYGIAAVEACPGEAVLHVAEVAEPGRRWALTGAVDEAVAAFRPRLGCGAAAPWPVHFTPGPIAGPAELDAWLTGLSATVGAGGVEVKRRDERGITLR
jgi:hypothetical protein